MALTELPALLFFTCFVLLFLRVINSDVVLSRETFGLAFLAGLCLGAAILGRQIYLIIVPALVVLIFWLREKWSPILICIITSLAVCSWLFVLWHGLAPPHYYRITESSVELCEPAVFVELRSCGYAISQSGVALPTASNSMDNLHPLWIRSVVFRAEL